jgi:DnaK suppressor protein
MRLNEMSYDTLREIDDAILRIDNGTYGVCEETQELIPVERLKVLPFARLTVKCQRDLEMNWSKRSHAVGIKFDDDDAVEEDSGEA